jgi:hypothetical protein
MASYEIKTNEEDGDNDYLQQTNINDYTQDVVPAPPVYNPPSKTQKYNPVVQVHAHPVFNKLVIVIGVLIVVLIIIIIVIVTTSTSKSNYRARINSYD